MSLYLIIRRVQVEGANAVAGLTWGFPAMTAFTGFGHNLCRQLKALDGARVEDRQLQQLELPGIGVVCHHHQVHAHQPKGWGDFHFALTRNPLTKEGKTAPVNEEGKMSLDLSLILSVQGLITGNTDQAACLIESVQHLIHRQRMAGGRIHAVGDIELVVVPEGEDDARTAIQQLMYSLLPGYCLIDRSHYFKAHAAACQDAGTDNARLHAFLDFTRLQYAADKASDTNDEVVDPAVTQAEKTVPWQYQPKPQTGYLVPIMGGYKAISPVYEPGTVSKARDQQTPFCFAEAVYTIGEWISPHRMTQLEHLLWQQHYKAPWYVCRTQAQIESEDDELSEHAVIAYASDHETGPKAADGAAMDDEDMDDYY